MVALVPCATMAAARGVGGLALVCAADVVIGTADVVMKDRNGPVPRRATAVELAAAVTVEEVIAHAG